VDVVDLLAGIGENAVLESRELAFDFRFPGVD
jgi:hypothetical protein